MRDINSILILIFFISISSISFSRAQVTHEILLQKAAEHYKLEDCQMSENGRWISSRKIYDSNQDTLLIFDNKQPGKPVAVFIKADQLHFLHGDRLLIKMDNYAVFMDLQKRFKKNYEDVKQVILLPDKKFAIFYNENAHHQLELYSAKNKLLQTLDNVDKIFTENEILWAVKNENDGNHSIFRISENSNECIYSTTDEIQDLLREPDGQNIFLFTYNADDDLLNINYIDIPNKKLISLRDIFDENFSFATVQTVKNGEKYFVSLELKEEDPAFHLVEIWNGNDSAVESKVHPQAKKAFYIWYPLQNKIEKIGNEELTECIYTGNPNYCICFNPLKNRNQTTFFADTPLDFFIYNLSSRQYSKLGKVDPNPIISRDGKYLIYQQEKKWILYDISKYKQIELSKKELTKAYFSSDNKMIYFESDTGLWKYQIQYNRFSLVPNTGKYKTRILNGEFESINNSQISSYQIDYEEPLLVKLEDVENFTQSYILVGDNVETMVPFTKNKILDFKHNSDYTRAAYLEENYNLPTRLVSKISGLKEKIVFQSNPDDSAVFNLKKEIISFTNSEGKPLKGALFYPFHYNPSKKYPMVVHIYQLQSSKLNYYPIVFYSTPNITDGFNLRLLLEEGYFVFFPDIDYGRSGPGITALDSVNHSLDALRKIHAIDSNKIGLTGHSYGGYETNFIATHSDRFATYISGSGISDIVASYFSFNYDYVMGNYIRYETGQFNMQKSFNEDQKLYYENNPINYIHKVQAPILLWAGKEDANIEPSQTMSFFMGLQRNGKTTVALFYPNEGHILLHENSSRDLTLRVLQWFNYFLKDEKNIDWINKAVKKDAT